ncbi:MAG: hypothetical protein HQM09_20515 [Candidatus Riflebacteria bacterium]|nr:hypothetical protein [Candidatus Riflebacteria bacterium]
MTKSHRIVSCLIILGVASLLAIPLVSAAPDPDPESEIDVSPDVKSGGIAAHSSGVVRHLVKIAKTDPDLVKERRDVREHAAYIKPGAKLRNQLLLYMTGSHGTGTMDSPFFYVAAEEGYHVLSLTYISGAALAEFRKSHDPDAFLKARNNNLYGTEPIGDFKTTKLSSILNRTVKALAYLDKTYPQEGWGAYLDHDQPAWSKMAVAGLSQGGGYAVLLGIQHRVDRVIAFGAPKDNSRFFHRPADWYKLPKATSLEKFFCFNHSLDEGHGCSYVEQVENEKALGLVPKYSIVDVDNNRAPYEHTRLLTSHRPAAEPKKNHGVIFGDPFYIDAWRYLLTEP